MKHTLGLNVVHISTITDESKESTRSFSINILLQVPGYFMMLQKQMFSQSPKFNQTLPNSGENSSLKIVAPVFKATSVF